MNVIVHGPQGCGKTRAADALKAHFGCASVVDDWNGRDALAHGALALTNLRPGEFSARPSDRVLSFEEAVVCAATSSVLVG